MENRRRRALREILCRQRRRYWGCGARHRNWLGGWDRCRACVSTGRSPFYLIGDGGATQPLPRFACQTTIAVQSVRRKPCGLQIVKPAYSCLKFKKLKHTRLALDYCANNSSPPDFYGNSTPLTALAESRHMPRDMVLQAGCRSAKILTGVAKPETQQLRAAPHREWPCFARAWPMPVGPLPDFSIK